MRRPIPEPVGPGQESVWDYPRPPALERVEHIVRVEFGGEVVAESGAALRVCETASPPCYYLPPGDVRTELLEPAPGRSVCEWKGVAGYWSLRVHDAVSHVGLRGAAGPPGLLPGARGRVLGGRRPGQAAAGSVLWRLDHSKPGGPVQGRAGDGVVVGAAAAA
jgi:uncharacterized protein (DUF427 family)